MSEPDVSLLFTVAQAIAVLDATPVTPRTASVLLSNSLGLRLAEDLYADRDYPPFDKSLMDGYAVRVVDLAELATGSPHIELRVTAEIAAGAQASRPVLAGEAHAIMTGAPIPTGADGIVPVEETLRVNQTTGAADANGNIVRIFRATSPGRYISMRGADLQAGRAVLTRGVMMGPAQIAAAAMVGAVNPLCYARPRVAVLSTGDEIVPADQAPGPAQIRNSNSPMLIALLTKLGCEVIDLGIVRDEPAILRAALLRGVSEFEALFVTGGMSMGTYDFVPRLLAEIGVEARVTKLRIKPGKPFLFGTFPRAGGMSYVFGLPGNPVSGFVCTVRLASRIIQRLSGGAVVEKWVSASLAEALPANGPREFYQPVALEVTAERTIARPLAWKGSADLFTLAQAQGLLARPENAKALAAGEMVRVLEI